MKKGGSWGISTYNPKTKKELIWSSFRDKKNAIYWFNKTTYANGGGVGYEPITKPVPTTKPQTPTKPDKNNPYKPKAIPRPKATKVNFEM